MVQGLHKLCQDLATILYIFSLKFRFSVHDIIATVNNHVVTEAHGVVIL